MGYKLRILSLGAGVQSTALYLMAERGEAEAFHCAIFADTGWEHLPTYQHLEWLRTVGKTPIITVTPAYGSIFDWHLEARMRKTGEGQSYINFPCHTQWNGRKGMLRRQCTKNFKILPIRKEIRRLLGVGDRRIPEGAVELSMGISLEEAHRMFRSNVKYIHQRFPLVDMRMTRWDCETWLARNYNGLVVPKSACVGCPFRSNTEWQEVKRIPEEWAQAVRLDEAIRCKGIDQGQLDGRLYLHASLQPLGVVDLQVADPRQAQFDFMKQDRLAMMVGGLSGEAL